MNTPTTIIDNGSGLIKAGGLSEELPKIVFPCVVGHSKETNKLENIGDFAQFSKDLNLQRPIQRGIINDWNDIEDIWDFTFEELQVESSDQVVMLTQAALTPPIHKEKMAQIMFEGFGVNGLDIMMQSLLELYFSGRTTGIVVDCGYGMCQVVPIYNGYMMEHATLRLNCAGEEINEYLRKLLIERGIIFSTECEKIEVERIKERLSYVAFDYKEESTLASLSSELDKKYELPDGQIISIGSERFKCSEVLFEPNIIGKETSGIHEITYNSIMQCDCDLRKEMYNNIVLCGGSSMFPGMKQRFIKEITILSPPTIQISVDCNRKRKYGAWIGGKLFASLSSFEERYIKKAEYDEFGASYINSKDKK
ncbi:actin-11, putative [Entamoeba dispar SAW760]|uniref:Actin-11, putative n=1 Tax=Entamoeba dispar (strain ATCC PRA-260 / SAW760) TaxID=370354 RepID=B0EEC2_ENTDS|nr:actin-11, putative [Entamoeba dispar SAW760]EDR27129.1 actin-11, putative [Entamoeba dispar SAW760]|eukprot:EDR27129.1 actin-11, putative [Entamoeba dispar SAW760]